MRLDRDSYKPELGSRLDSQDSGLNKSELTYIFILTTQRVGNSMTLRNDIHNTGKLVHVPHMHIIQWLHTGMLYWRPCMRVTCTCTQFSDVPKLQAQVRGVGVLSHKRVSNGCLGSCHWLLHSASVTLCVYKYLHSLFLWTGASLHCEQYATHIGHRQDTHSCTQYIFWLYTSVYMCNTCLNIRAQQIWVYTYIHIVNE